MDKAGILMIISGPSGSGKGTVVNELLKDEQFALSISATTRNPRPGEIDGKHYFFKTKDEFKNLIEENMLLEWACFCDNYYGTPLKYVTDRLEEGRNVVLEIEVQGALQVKEKYPEAVLVFLIPPTLDELRKRLTNRATETAEVIEKRIERAGEEIELIDRYDYVVINERIDEAKRDILKIVCAEKMNVKRNENIKKLFKGESL
ncbi:MAG: guanylate kinase [Lachnospiraceae bacterium]|nr:guanylate kinase [Lachnospiraceae bacterium]